MSKKYYLTSLIEINNWKLLQIFHGSSYLNLSNDFYRIGVNKTPFLLVFSNKKQFGYLTIKRGAFNESSDYYADFQLEFEVKDHPDFDKTSSYETSVEISENSIDAHKINNALSIQRELNSNSHIIALRLEFNNGKSLYIYDNDVNDGAIIEYNSKNWLSNFTSLYDLPHTLVKK